MSKKQLFILFLIGFIAGLFIGDFISEKYIVKAATEDDLYLAASVVQSEAGNQSEMGQRLVADVIFNRLESEAFPNSVSAVIHQRGQFTKRRLAPPPSILQIVEEELYFRTNSEVLWFKTKKYHTYGHPIIQEGDHYFSGR